jgi:hypothetical protein
VGASLPLPVFCALLWSDYPVTTQEEKTMTPEEKFIFDLQGYLVVKEVG